MNTEKPTMIYIWHIKEVKYQKKNYLRIFHVKVKYWVHPAPVKRSRLYVCPFFVDAPSGEISVAFQIFDFLRFIENLEV